MSSVKRTPESPTLSLYFVGLKIEMTTSTADKCLSWEESKSQCLCDAADAHHMSDKGNTTVSDLLDLWRDVYQEIYSHVSTDPVGLRITDGLGKLTKRFLLLILTTGVKSCHWRAWDVCDSGFWWLSRMMFLKFRQRRRTECQSLILYQLAVCVRFSL